MTRVSCSVTARITKKAISTWVERWRDREVALGDPSPFGVTDAGSRDFRGVSLRNVVLKDSVVGDADFTAADLDHMRIENCALRNCNFDRATLTQLVTKASRFDDCRFRKADLRIANIGYCGTDFCRCVFDGVRVTRAGFLNAVFTDVEFIGKDWSHTVFNASGFWNCSFRGALKGITFRGDYLFPTQREIAGEPHRTGLHNVSFANADLHWVEFSNGCKLENVVLPTNGSVFICQARNLISAYASFGPGSKEHEVLTRYLGIVRPNPLKQSEEIISRNDLIKLGGDEMGAMLYALLKSRLRN